MLACAASFPVETFGGRVHVEWAENAPVTPLGQLAFFVDFLKTAGLWEQWVQACPLEYSSNNAPAVGDVLGTLFLSALAGHRRYAHVTSLRADQVSPGMLGMGKVVSEDSARSAFKDADPGACAGWQQEHLRFCYEPLLYEPWILDVDVTVKQLYGRQEGACKGYNPQKPGRPCHTYHTYLMARTRLVLDVEIRPGNEGHSSYTRPALWAWLNSLPRQCWPRLIRGDCDWGNETQMSECEKHEQCFLFKLRQTPKAKKLIEHSFARRDWVVTEHGWEVLEDRLRLSGWSRSRRVIVLRRRIEKQTLLHKQLPVGQQEIQFAEVVEGVQYEYAILVTNLDYEVCSFGQLYRDRADAENVFDEIKNQWGWGGYVTNDLGRCQIMARIVAQVYDWWSLFVRLAIPEKHAEAITSRPLLLFAIGRQTRHAGQTKLIVSSIHQQAKKIQAVVCRIAAFLSTVRATAEQLTHVERWRLILSRIFVIFLQGRPLVAPNLIPAPP
jgi:hypothetical protein